MASPMRRAELVKWVATRVMPHEPAVRAWLRRRRVPKDEIDELIQEGYCRLAGVEAPDDIINPGAFFLTTVRNLLSKQRARSQVVQIDIMSDITEIAGADVAPDPELMTGDRVEFDRVRAVIATLPERCRQVLELRKLEGLSQREVAARMGIAETIVENEGARALRLLIEGLRTQGDNIARDYEERRSRGRRT